MAIAIEQQIQSDVEHLKMQFPNTRDLYREVCTLLFFRYGITPTANKLYQYVRKGSMSAPAEALNKFWLELREKSRVRIESPDIPEKLKEVAGSLVMTLWDQAQEAARVNTFHITADAEARIAKAEEENKAAVERITFLERNLRETESRLEIALKKASETEKNHAVHIHTLTTLEKSLTGLQQERDSLNEQLAQSREGFRQDLQRLNASLSKAEERYRAVEAKALLEIDRERQLSREAENQLRKIQNTIKSDQFWHQKEVTALQARISNLRENSGKLQGEVRLLKGQLKVLSKQLGKREREIVTIKSKLSKK